MSTDKTNQSSLLDASPIIHFRGSIFASVKQSASRGIGKLRVQYRQSNNIFTTTAPPAHTSEPHTFEHNGIVSPSIASNPNKDNTEYHTNGIVPPSIGLVEYGTTVE